MPAEAAGIRTVHLRTGIVLAKEGGVLARMLLPFKLGLGGRIGSGRQYMSWISLEDELGAILHVISTPTLAGPVNATAPTPVTNAEFTKALGHAVHRPTFLPTPVPALKVVYGSELVDHLLVEGQRVVPDLLESPPSRSLTRASTAPSTRSCRSRNRTGPGEARGRGARTGFAVA